MGTNSNWADIHGGGCKNSDVIKNWVRGGRAKNYKNTMRTDGKSLYSYTLEIGFTTDDDKKVVLDYTAKSGLFASQTTSCHVGLARRSADEVMHPDAYKVIRNRAVG